MKANVILKLISLALLSYAKTNAQNKMIATNESNYAYADSIMQAEYKANAPGAVLLIAKEGKSVFEKAYGLANVELEVPNRTEYEFEIGSNTKQFTAVSILQLVQKGKIDLQDDIHKFLPEYNTYEHRITVENLLTHTSGIPDYFGKGYFNKNFKNDVPRDSIVEWFSSDSLLFEPGTDWSYSNSGYFLLARIIEKVSGVSYEDYVQKNIFEPLHMDHTSFGTHDKVIPGMVTGYDPGKDGNYKDAEYLSWSWVYSAGAIISNTADLLKWDNALYAGKIVDPVLLQKAWQNHRLKDSEKSQYGYGWFINNTDGVPIVWHGGIIPGFLSATFHLPDQHLYIALLTNNTRIDPIALGMIISLQAAGHPATPPKILTPDPQWLNDYTGIYKLHAQFITLVSNSSFGEIVNNITREGDTLFSQVSGGNKVALLPISKDVFISSGTGIHSLFYTTYHFVRDTKGKMNAIKINEPFSIFMDRTQIKINNKK